MARGGSRPQGKRHDRVIVRGALLEARWSLLILVEEEAVGSEDLVERMGCGKAHKRQLLRECRMCSRRMKRAGAHRAAHDGGNRERRGGNATQGKGKSL
jgi:hypothetical protein